MTFLIRFFSLAALLLLAACPQLPQPFQHDGANPLLEIDGKAGVVLAFETDIPKALAPALRDALVRHDVPAFLDKAPREAFPLRLKLRKNAPRANTVELELFWELYDTDGLIVDHYDQKLRVVESDWDKGAPALMKRLANEAAPHLAGLMPADEGTKANSQLAALGAKPRLFVQPVTGAPGDGNDALARAMRLSLSANGIEMTEGAGTGIYRLQGTTKVAKADAKSDNLRLDWTLFDPSGAEMATLDQEGLVPSGLLDKPWGPLAGEIVAGTAIELSALIKQVGPAKRKP
jgi:hypothetical protein